MDAGTLIREITATYERHGWTLRRVLLKTATRDALLESETGLFGDALVQEADFDALWFARTSSAGREAWELRLVAEQAYALFEAFESGETEEERDEARLEMENRMRAYVMPA